jgi:hypothetical protein
MPSLRANKDNTTQPSDVPFRLVIKNPILCSERRHHESEGPKLVFSPWITGEPSSYSCFVSYYYFYPGKIEYERGHGRVEISIRRAYPR